MTPLFLRDVLIGQSRTLFRRNSPTRQILCCYAGDRWAGERVYGSLQLVRVRGHQSHFQALSPHAER